MVTGKRDMAAERERERGERALNDINNNGVIVMLISILVWPKT